MRTTILAVLLLLCLSATAQSLTVAESEATIAFLFLDEDIEGTIGGLQFTGDIDLNALENSSISGSVVTKTLDTNNWLRSRHLRSKKFFHAKEFPTLTFESSKVSGEASAFRVEGFLTIKGIERSIIWEFINQGKQLIGTSQINTQDFDVSIYDERERNEVAISIVLPYSN